MNTTTADTFPPFPSAADLRRVAHADAWRALAEAVDLSAACPLIHTRPVFAGGSFRQIARIPSGLRTLLADLAVVVEGNADCTLVSWESASPNAYGDGVLTVLIGSIRWESATNTWAWSLKDGSAHGSVNPFPVAQQSQ